MGTPIKLIADSGSTKTEWAVGPAIVRTQGINPIHQDEDAIRSILRDELLPQLHACHATAEDVKRVLFYGSGVRPDKEATMECLLREVFTMAGSVEARSDMLGAARALFGTDEGQACILGTGANSCLYNGKDIVANTPPLGFILGDEGSGAVLGKMFLNAIYKDGLYPGAREDFERHFSTTLGDVIDRVYRQPMPNRWLASLSPYIHEHLGKPQVRDIVVENFRNFIRRNVLPYHRQDLPLSAVGSIAHFYEAELRAAARAEGYAVGRVQRGIL